METEGRCRPFAGVIQTDEVVEPGHLFLTTASSRRATGTHYTPIQYTRAMVQETLDPLVYVGENGKLRRVDLPKNVHRASYSTVPITKPKANRPLYHVRA